MFYDNLSLSSSQNIPFNIWRQHAKNVNFCHVYGLPESSHQIDKLLVMFLRDIHRTLCRCGDIHRTVWRCGGIHQIVCRYEDIHHTVFCVDIRCTLCRCGDIHKRCTLHNCYRLPLQVGCFWWSCVTEPFSSDRLRQSALLYGKNWKHLDIINRRAAGSKFALIIINELVIGRLARFNCIGQGVKPIGSSLQDSYLPYVTGSAHNRHVFTVPYDHSAAFIIICSKTCANS